MAFRILYIKHRAKLRKKFGFLCLKESNKKYKIPLPDIEVIMIDNLYSSISTNLLDALMKHNVLMLGCDSHHLPIYMTLPINSHYKRLPIIVKQFKLPNRTRGRLWQKIIKRKILNEILVLKATKSKGIQSLNVVRKNVIQYDRKHCESIAAKIYFEELYGKAFTRRNSNVINSALNYGYSLIRSLIARDICVEGLEPSLGIWHCNQLNTFNLADDLIEPFRSIVDLFVYRRAYQYERCLSSRDKKELLKILLLSTKMNAKHQSLVNAIHIEVESYCQCALHNSTRLALPKLEIKEEFK